MPEIDARRITASASASVASGENGDRIDHHAALEPLDLADFLGLVGGLEVAVDDADAAGLRHGDSEPGLGDGVHRRGHDRQVRGIERVRRVAMLTPLGITAEWPGRKRTSSNASPSGKPLFPFVIAMVLFGRGAPAACMARLPTTAGAKFL